jgi:predicted alpha/beta-hydrolase family hydrolase
MTQLLWTYADGDPVATLVLAHGAGAPMDTPYMTTFSDFAAASGLRVARFEFGYMARRRTGGGRRPPPRAEKLVGEFADAAQAVGDRYKTPILIGGKSMGGRVAAILGGQPEARTLDIRGVVCLGYPFHPPAKPDQLRLAPLAALEVDTLICQGTRDPFGTKAEVALMTLPERVRILWFADGDHDLKPRRSAAVTWERHLSEAARATGDFAREAVSG